MKTLRWSAAAAILILLGTGAYFFYQTKTPQQVAVKPSARPSNNLPSATNKENDTPSTGPQTNPNENIPLASAGTNDNFNEEIYHYTRLVELKQNEIKQLAKDEPLLYRQFAGDINKLDSAFHVLRKQLPANPNREQLLEAMLQNLRLQEALLNRQLDIIKQIDQAKKNEYEKVYKTT